MAITCKVHTKFLGKCDQTEVINHYHRWKKITLLWSLIKKIIKPKSSGFFFYLNLSLFFFLQKTRCPVKQLSRNNVLNKVSQNPGHTAGLHVAPELEFSWDKVSLSEIFKPDAGQTAHLIHSQRREKANLPVYQFSFTSDIRGYSNFVGNFEKSVWEIRARFKHWKHCMNEAARHIEIPSLGSNVAFMVHFQL